MKEDTSREKRRRRRVRNQIFAYLILVLIIVLIVAAGYFGVRGIINYVEGYKDKVDRVIEEAESDAALLQESSAGDSSGEPDIQESAAVTEADEGYTPDESNDPLGDLIESLLNNMTIEEMVAGMFMVSPESLTGVGTAIKAGDGTKTAIAENPVGGIIYSEKNFKSADQFTQMLSNTKGFSKYRLFTALKAECGSKGFGLDATPKASDIADDGSARNAYGSIAAKLASYGVDMNLAPVAELATGKADASLQGRTFGSDAAVAAPLVSAAVQSMQESKVSASLQKFPGTAVGAKNLEELKNSEFVVYAAAIRDGVDCITVSNTKAEGLTGDDTPACLSAAVIKDALRGTLGFGGIIITDYLNEKSVTASYTPAEAAIAAIQAGADILLEPAGYKEAYEGVLKAVTDGTITKERIYESIYRIYRVKYKNELSQN